MFVPFYGAPQQYRLIIKKNQNALLTIFPKHKLNRMHVWYQKKPKNDRVKFIFNKVKLILIILFSHVILTPGLTLFDASNK